MKQLLKRTAGAGVGCLLTLLWAFTAFAASETAADAAAQVTLADQMKEAAVYSAFGMGTVFVVLIFISLIISCFKFIHEWEEKTKKQEEK